MTMTKTQTTTDENGNEITVEIQEQDLEKELEKEEEIKADDDDDVETLKKKLETSEAQKKHWRGKAQKPAAKAETKPDEKALTQMDILALARSNVHDEDIADIVDYAKFKGISVAEALNAGTVKAIIAEKTEFRKTAEVTATGNAKRTTSKVTDQALLENANNGVIPEKGSEDADRLFWLRRGGKR